MEHNDFPPAHFPDGLTEPLIDALLAEVFAQVEPVRRPSSPFADHVTDVRRERRQRNRVVGDLRRTHYHLAEMPSQGNGGRCIDGHDGCEAA